MYFLTKVVLSYGATLKSAFRKMVFFYEFAIIEITISIVTISAIATELSSQ